MFIATGPNLYAAACADNLYDFIDYVLAQGCFEGRHSPPFDVLDANRNLVAVVHPKPSIAVAEINGRNVLFPYPACQGA